MERLGLDTRGLPPTLPCHTLPDYSLTRRINPTLLSSSLIAHKTKKLFPKKHRCLQLGAMVLIVPHLKYLLHVGVVGINQSMKNELSHQQRIS